MEDTIRMLGLLRKYDLSPMERVVLGHTGTVQHFLGILFNEPVAVEMISQREAGRRFHRKSHLFLKSNGVVVCYAHSMIVYKEDVRQGAIEDVRAGILGIGHIASRHGIPMSRMIEDFSVGQHFVSRLYSMESQDLSYLINETYPRDLFAYERSLGQSCSRKSSTHAGAVRPLAPDSPSTC